MRKNSIIAITVFEYIINQAFSKLRILVAFLIYSFNKLTKVFIL